VIQLGKVVFPCKYRYQQSCSAQETGFSRPLTYPLADAQKSQPTIRLRGRLGHLPGSFRLLQEFQYRPIEHAIELITLAEEKVAE
jgi:hypothetical protein